MDLARAHSKNRHLRDGLAKLQVGADELAGRPLRPLTPLPGAVRLDARMGPNRIAQLIDEYQAGMPTTELARTFGVGKGTIIRLLHAAGVPMRRQGPSAEQVREAVRLYAQGLSLAVVGERLGFDAHTVRRALLRAGVVMRDSHGRQPRY